MTTATKPIEELSTEELEQLLAKKKESEKQAQKEKERVYEKEKDDFVKATVAEMQSLSSEMKTLKKNTITRGNTLHEKVYDIYGKEEQDLKRFSLVSKDGLSKVEIERRDISSLNEKAEVAINTIKEVMKEKFAGRNKRMYNIIDGILIKNKAGDYDEKLVTKLRKHEEDVNDKRFSQALDDLAKAYSITGTSTYCRGYIWDEEFNKWVNVPMQFSSM